VSFLSDEKRDEAYLHASTFFLDQMGILLKDGWKRDDHNPQEVLFKIYKPTQNKGCLKLILPKTFAPFLDISKANTWRTMFENPAIFKAEKQGNNHNIDLYIGSSLPLASIFYLLQLIAPGMFVIYYEYQLPDADVKVSRVLPRASWIETSVEVMSKTEAFLAAAKDRKIAFLEERTPRPQSSSHHNPLSGTDAPPAAAKDQKTASPKKRTPRPQSSSHHNPLSGTDAPPATAKTASPKKRTARPRNTQKPEYTIIPGYLNNDVTDGGCDWTVCDRDCGWCGRCRLN